MNGVFADPYPTKTRKKNISVSDLINLNLSFFSLFIRVHTIEIVLLIINMEKKHIEIKI